LAALDAGTILDAVGSVSVARVSEEAVVREFGTTRGQLQSGDVGLIGDGGVGDGIEDTNHARG
jgi:hypothetical protein